MVLGYQFDTLNVYEIVIDSLFYYVYEEVFGISTQWDKIEKWQKELRDNYADYYATVLSVGMINDYAPQLALICTFLFIA